MALGACAGENEVATGFLTEIGPWLADALVAVRRAGFIGTAHRAAIWCALSCSRTSPHSVEGEMPDVESTGALIIMREDFRRAADAAVLRSFSTIAELMATLPGEQNARLRRRVQTLSRARNVESRPDVNLVAGVVQALLQRSS